MMIGVRKNVPAPAFFWRKPPLLDDVSPPAIVVLSEKTGSRQRTISDICIVSGFSKSRNLIYRYYRIAFSLGVDGGKIGRPVLRRANGVGSWGKGGRVGCLGRGGSSFPINYTGRTVFAHTG